MKVCVFGAGAIGGLMAAKLAGTGAELTVVARGAHLHAMQRDGLTLLGEDGARTVHAVNACAAGHPVGVQDCVILATKSHSLLAALPDIVPLIGPHTVILPALNGIPWWFCEGFDSRLEGWQPDGVDPAGRLARAIPAASVLGCVVYLSACVPEPGVVQHTGRWGLALGRPSGEMTLAQRDVADLLRAAGFDCSTPADIRNEVWIKVMGNATLNPASALSCAPLQPLIDDPDAHQMLVAAMDEVIAVGRELGLQPRTTAQERLAQTRTFGLTKISMLQDVEQARPLEIDALTGAVAGIAGRVGVAVPVLRGLLGLIRQRGKTLTPQET